MPKYDRHNRKHYSLQRDKISKDNYRRTKKTSKTAEGSHSELKAQNCRKRECEKVWEQ